jgi:NAD(P)-dependent dehydrogenase (short-subunit alcohol dehydrogenase family)
VELLVPRIASGGAIAVVASNAGMGWQQQLPQLMELVAADGFDAGREWCEQHKDMLETQAYAMSKRVINAWVAFRAATLIAAGVRLNCINPGPTETAMMPYFENYAGKDVLDAYLGPIARRSTPDEQAWPLVFLNSPRSSFVNGESMTTDGGFLGAVVTGQVTLAAPAGAAER